MPPPSAAKTDASPAAPAAAARGEKSAPPPEPAPVAAAPAASGGLRAWIPIIAAIVIAPAMTWGTVEFVLLPRLEKKLNLPPAAALAAVNADESGGSADKSGRPKEPSTYEFSNVVVNLAGTMGTRYLKTSFHVLGDPKGNVDVKKIFEDNRTMLMDTTLNVLSSLTLGDLEEPGAKNVIREKLVNAYNQALNKRVVDQVYFSDFVVQ
ncbi:MAG TPA: flagellar basal body-associated FliL family protein [Opitutaceae bacterium]|nr:flagellar basal body-associated FliL family protein [Opitutaceae bacterium]